MLSLFLFNNKFAFLNIFVCELFEFVFGQTAFTRLNNKKEPFWANFALINKGFPFKV